ncbi:MAG: VOC family protein [Propionibacteriaceae bacterium]|jgi:catechol 2,3-dioxygenase-like lactoylglutathione lyase family enzyme|nr:VOC family protein [Propionibacteriaceae bacterium]
MEKLFTGMNHVGLTVSDIDQSVAFYTEIMGMELDNIRYDVDLEYIRTITGYPDGILHVAFVVSPGLRLELIQYVQPKGDPHDGRPHNPRSSHLCFATSDAMKGYALCLEKGIPVINPPVLIDSGPSTGAIAFYLHDPDGYNLEIYQPAVKS